MTVSVGSVYATFHVGEIANGSQIQDVESFYRMDGVAIAIHTEAFEKAISPGFLQN